MLGCALIKKCGRLLDRGGVGDLVVVFKLKVDVFTFWLSSLTVLSQVWLKSVAE
jgi:hypothetical protein